MRLVWGDVGAAVNQPSLFRGVHPTIRQVQASQPLTARQLELAEQVYIMAYASRCPHQPPCGSRGACIRQIARSQKEKGYVK